MLDDKVKAPEATRAKRQSGFQLPTDGVYTYITRGYESLTGDRHDYPERTHAIVRTRGSCTWRFEHKIIEEHVDAYSSCNRPATVDVVDWFLHRQFLGVTLDEAYECEGSSFLVAAGSVGDRFAIICKAKDEDRIDLEGRRLDSEPVSIDKRVIQAIRLSMKGAISGNPDGEMRIELWVDPETGLRLKETRDVDAKVSAGLSGHYHEEGEFTLESLSPAK